MNSSPPSSPKPANSGGGPVPVPGSPTGDSSWRGRQVTRPSLLPGATNLTHLASYFSTLTGRPWEERDVALPLLFAGGCKDAPPLELTLEELPQERLSDLAQQALEIIQVGDSGYKRANILRTLNLFPKEAWNHQLGQALRKLFEGCKEGEKIFYAVCRIPPDTDTLVQLVLNAPISATANDYQRAQILKGLYLIPSEKRNHPMVQAGISALFSAKIEEICCPLKLIKRVSVTSRANFVSQAGILMGRAKKSRGYLVETLRLLPEESWDWSHAVQVREALCALFGGIEDTLYRRDGGILLFSRMEKIAKDERLSCLFCIAPFAHLAKEEEIRGRVLCALSLFPKKDRSQLLAQRLFAWCRETSFLNQLLQIPEADRMKWCIQHRYSSRPSRPSSSCSRSRSRSLGSAI